MFILVLLVFFLVFWVLFVSRIGKREGEAVLSGNIFPVQKGGQKKKEGFGVF